MCIVDTQPASRSVTADRMNTPSPMILRTLLFGALSLFLGCSHQSSSLRAELFPETQQPHFKTCAARVEGTYQERKLQQHLVVDIYQEPAPDQGPMTADCITRE